jgi:hypothetical protein
MTFYYICYGRDFRRTVNLSLRQITVRLLTKAQIIRNIIIKNQLTENIKLPKYKLAEKHNTKVLRTVIVTKNEVILHSKLSYLYTKANMHESCDSSKMKCPFSGVRTRRRVFQFRAFHLAPCKL